MLEDLGQSYDLLDKVFAHHNVKIVRRPPHFQNIPHQVDNRSTTMKMYNYNFDSFYTNNDQGVKIISFLDLN